MGFFTNINKTNKKNIEDEIHENKNIVKSCENCINLSTYNIGKENEYTTCRFENICTGQHWKSKK